MTAVRIWIVRGLVLGGVTLLGYVLWLLLAPRGLAWIVWTLGGVVLAFVILELALRARRSAGRAGDEERWRSSLGDPRARRAAIAELRSKIGRARRLGPRLRVEHARLAILLAEILEADGKSEQAIAALAKVPLDELAPLEAAVVRHARAQAYLHAGDPDGADVALSALSEPAGEEVLDAAIALARGAILASRGALDEAEAVARTHGEHEDDELRAEARALLAACAHARGAADEAAALVAAIDPEQRGRIARIGPAIVRAVLA